MNNTDYYAIFPLKLLDDSRYNELSVYEFFLYLLLLNRTNFLKKKLTKFSDEKGIFIYYSNDKIRRELRCSDKRATKTLSNLEEVGLIRREYQQNGLPLKIYVNDVREQNRENITLESDLHNSSKKFTQKQKVNDKNVSFDVEKAERRATENPVDFGSMKNKKRQNRKMH